jgi:hypothetical protein
LIAAIATLTAAVHAGGDKIAFPAEYARVDKKSLSRTLDKPVS